MTEPFVAQLRTSGNVIAVGVPSANPLTIRVEIPEIWNVGLLSASSSTSVSAVKRAALEAMWPDGDDPSEYVIKLRGFEVLDENETLAASGAKDGSIFLLTHRRKRPVR